MNYLLNALKENKSEPKIDAEIKSKIIELLGAEVLKNTMKRLKIDENSAIDIALREEIKTGKAEILCELENEKIEKYEIEIQRIYVGNNEDNKSMLIKVTDPQLIEKTGGIVQRNEWCTNNTEQ